MSSFPADAAEGEDHPPQYTTSSMGRSLAQMYSILIIKITYVL